MRRPSLAAALLLLCAAGAPAETIRLADGDTITGPITASDAASITVNHPSLGEITIARDQVVEVYDDAQALDAALAAEAAEAAALADTQRRDADDGVFGLGVFFPGWDRRLELGVNGAEGNSRNANVRAGFNAHQEDEDGRWDVDLLYRVTRSNSVTSENRFQAQALRDWFFPGEDYFLFATGKLEWDDFEDFETRLSGFFGGGCRFHKDDEFEVNGRVGFGGNQTYGGASSDFTAEALIGLDVDWTIATNQSLAFSTDFFPSLENGGEFRNVTTLDWILSIDRDRGLSLKLGLANEYDSEVSAGVDKNDFTYYAALVWDF